MYSKIIVVLLIQLKMDETWRDPFSKKLQKVVKHAENSIYIYENSNKTTNYFTSQLSE